MSTSPAGAPQSDTPPLSEAARIIDTFIAPSRTFADLRHKSRWWVPWLIISVFSIAFMLVVNQQVGFDQIARNTVAQSSRAAQIDQLPPDQRAQRLSSTATFIEVMAFASPLTGLLIYLVVAAVLMGTFRFGAGADIGFKRSLAIVMYGALPSVLGAVLGIVSLLAGANPESFNLANPVASNPAYFMDPGSNKFFYNIASGLDVFTIWSIVLMAIGFACHSKLRRSTTLGVIGAWYVLWKLVAAGLALLS